MVAPARNSRRTLLMLCLASGGWAFGFGLGAPLASLWLRDAGHSSRVIGLNTSFYYLGVAVDAALLLSMCRRRHPRRRCRHRPLSVGRQPACLVHAANRRRHGNRPE